MALVAVALSYFTQNPIDYLMMAIAGASAVLVYAGKNLIAVLHSDSPAGSLSLVNIISALLIAIGTGIIDGAAMYYINGVIVWSILLKLAGGIVLTYVTATWFAPPYTTTKQRLLV